jgi:8-oxo-dGTP pyrophosphatase MutT (NUDIX family)
MTNELQAAAVLVLSYHHEGEDYIVLTRRTEEVLHHKGQICFPGGAVDPEDKGLWETALREAKEEIGLDPGEVTFVREMTSRPTPSGFQVTPFLASIPAPSGWNPNPSETAEVFAVPISYLKNPENVQLTKKEWGGEEYLDPVFKYKNYEIWGLTGRILCDVLELGV